MRSEHLGSPRQAVMQAATADSEVRLTMVNRDLATAKTKLRETETRIANFESKVWSLSMAKSHAEACAKAWEQRALAGEARAMEAETKMLSWEARAAIAESNLATTSKSASERGRETDKATTLLTNEVEKRIAAESRATVAEGTLGCLHARVQTLAREVAMAEVRAQERISVAESHAIQRVRDADRRVGQAEHRAHSCDKTASAVIAEFRRQASLSPRKATSKGLAQMTGAQSPRGLGMARRFSAGSPMADDCKLRCVQSQSPVVDVACCKTLPTFTPACHGRGQVPPPCWDISRAGSQATTADELGSASVSEPVATSTPEVGCSPVGTSSSTAQ